MTTANTDLRFFTNEPNQTLHDRFLKTLEYAQYFDVLVGYFRTSGFRRLYEALEKTEKIRILVGLNVDHEVYSALTGIAEQGGIDFESHEKIRETFSRQVQNEFATSEDNYDVELSVRKFSEFVEAGKLEVRGHPSRNLHAKVYISRFPKDFVNYGSVITGSSNFSESGLVSQREFNVELKDRPDVDYALEKFEELWAEGVDISDEYLDTVRKKTWLSDSVTPYELYLKLLYEYFKEDINLDTEADFSLPEGFLDLAYQRQAVITAKKILDAYGGVFLADVVGLGKTFISALLLQQLPGKALVICPPVLIDYWRDTLRDFYVPGCDVESLGKLESILEKGVDRYQYILVDEAHRFRNDATQSYEHLTNICRGKKVILVSATPLNNRLGDILSQLKLFQPPRRSDIPGVPNLESFFGRLQSHIKAFDKDTPEHLDAVKESAEEARDKVLKHVMVRRTRSEIRNYYSDDLAEQNLHFPEIGDPRRIVYTFDDATERLFNDTIELLKQFDYARYTPLLYLKQTPSQIEQAQRNVGGFMKMLLVKRLESSFFAFKNTLKRFVGSYKNFIGMLDSGEVWISKDVDVFELIENENFERLEHLLSENRAERYDASQFRNDFRRDLNADLELLETLERMWQKTERDPKFEQFVRDISTEPLLKTSKLIIFSEAAETVDYLYRNLSERIGPQVMAFRGNGGTYRDESYGKETARNLVTQNFDPNHHNQADDIRLLVTTDVLAEGINLHRANVLINYDLPWNPTRVLQRVGRVNRVGTEHDKIYVYNIFPTAQSDEHLGLEANIISKIQAFHNTLGEDAKYLSDEEEVATHRLFGERLYQRLNSIEGLDDGDEDSELKYLQTIREIRDENPDLFERIKRLPQKARSGRITPRDPEMPSDQLLTFFRRGKLKRFVRADDIESTEVTFLEAAKQFACEPDAERQPIPEHYYGYLDSAKQHLAALEREDPMEPQRRGSSNAQQILKALKATRHYKRFTDDDEAFLRQVRDALEAGILPKNRLKIIKDELQQQLKQKFEPLKLLALLRRQIGEQELTPPQRSDRERKPTEIILSAYLHRSES